MVAVELLCESIHNIPMAIELRDWHSCRAILRRVVVFGADRRASRGQTLQRLTSQYAQLRKWHKAYLTLDLHPINSENRIATTHYLFAQGLLHTFEIRCRVELLIEARLTRIAFAIGITERNAL